MKSKSSTAMDNLSKLTLLGTTALVASFGMMQTAYAQDNTETTSSDDEMDEIVATGIRQSLKTARDFKRNADTAVDSITASDASTLPDLSVAEALARVPGVVAQRFNIDDNNGGDFPSPEGGGNLIRGLTLVRSEFNSRDAFSANGGRSLDFGTVPPELIGAVDVYKNTSADLIEGGIGGTINLRTLEPFDRDDVVAVATIDGTYTDLRKEWSPDYSVLLGNRWDTAAGEFGLLGSFASSELKSDLHGFQIGQLVPLTVNGSTIALPSGYQLRTNDVDRERDSYYLAGQWRDKSGDLQVTAKYSLIENDVNSNERTLESFSDGESWNQINIEGDFLTSDFTSSGIPQCQGENDGAGICENTQAIDGGLFEEGIVSNNLRDWTGARGSHTSNLGINKIDKSKTDDISLNIKWRPSDQWYVQLDGHKTTADFSSQQLWVGSRFFADFKVNSDLDNPRVELFPDLASNPNTRTGTSTSGDGAFDNPDNVYLLFSSDEFRQNDGEMYAVKGDIEYEFANDGWFDSIKFGARYADREQTNRASNQNWSAVGAPWEGGGYVPLSGLAQPGFEAVDFSNFFRGGVVGGDNTTVLFPDRALIQDYAAYAAFVANDPNLYGWTGRSTDGTLGGVDYQALADAGQGSIGEVREKTQNYYGRLDFENEFNNGMSIDGNIGVRYSKVDVTGIGAFTYNSLLSQESRDTGVLTTNDLRLLNFIPEAVAYSEQTAVPQGNDITSDARWLPSLNVKWNLNEDQLLRFAISKGVTRPRIDQLRSDQSANVSNTFITTTDTTVPEEDRVIDIITNRINVYGGNPDLKPILSTNIDFSYEHYFGDNNSFTASVFHKDIKNNIIYAQQTLEVLDLDGTQVEVLFNGDLNQDEATVTGTEIAYQQFFDEWPGFLSNFGVQANYTYIDAETNAPLPAPVAGDPNFGFERTYRYGVNNFLGLSEHSYNLIGIYQDEKLEARVAYNWRSEYLSSYRDYVTGNPIFQEDRGYLDGSVKYDFTENFQLRFQIANILNTQANATQQIDADGQRFGRTAFIGDRRIRIGARYQF